MSKFLVTLGASTGIIHLLYCTLCMFTLSSCNSCASTNDKLLNGIDNLMGKVDRFLEENKAVAKPQPSIDYEKEGVNTKHLFIFTDTTMTYNGKSFMPGMTIGELCEIFGQYERLAEPGIYIWDSIGLTMVSPDKSRKESVPIDGILLDWNIDLSGVISEDNIKWLRNRCPHHYFTGKIIVGGAVLGRGMHIDEFLKKTSLKFDNDPFPLLYFCDLYDWDYTKAPIHRKEEYYTYEIGKSEDGTDINHFWISTNTRSIGDPPYDGPEYKKYVE
ncbi:MULTISPECIES: DUF7738 domain-containing protein [Bacteroides]|uniref:DUF7738 domain-containing protein n=1 Tax=Bacteroides TaxID=816 RepID=UPI0006722B1B|nr:hypothetical protein [Bacteroides fragilis]QCQ54856.1 hypothetical protein EC81_014090 [Bacteroides fragilis]